MRNLFLYLNGEILPERDARVSVFDRGFLYGDGLFETLKGVRGRALMLEEHLARLRRSCACLQLPYPDSVDWETVIAALFEANNLTGEPAVVKIVLTRGVIEGRGLPWTDSPTLVIYIRPHSELPPEDYVRGMSVTVFPGSRGGPLAPHKTLAYLTSLFAREYAIALGFEEALLTDRDGCVLEACGSNLVWIKGNTLYVTPPDQRLPGVTESALRDALAAKGMAVREQSVLPEELEGADAVFLTNSLMGVIPVTRLNDLKLNRPGYIEITARFNRLIFESPGKPNKGLEFPG
ncbi:MAG: hypothetical protein C4575_05935 [Desulforudis sp.]|jgi:branched-subunit amino acid aminotransferase/4-amino-4-deoxychorismate lyase|nr:aminotransferase class IV [Clostridia bacterium]MDQ7791331.1 aminotransferase class IV [Clostridia bacterium]RJX20661.1 MAG: hypothetical protein C4575_05935 [Desulforudis sp.]